MTEWLQQGWQVRSRTVSRTQRPGKDRSMKVLITLMTLVCVLTASARLGESETGCDMRYNKGQRISQTQGDKMYPLITGQWTTNKTYSYQGWHVKVGFLKGFACRVEYSAIKGIANPTDEEIAAILEANGGLRSWRQIKRDELPNLPQAVADVFRRATGPSIWARQDGAYAYRPNFTNKLRLENRDAIQRDSEVSASKNTPKIVPKF